MTLEELKQPERLGVVASIISKFTARTDVVFGKVLLQSATPVLVAFVEIIAAAVLMFFYIGGKPFVQKFRELGKEELISITISAALTSVLGPLFFLIGLKHTSAINTSLLVNLNPLFLSIAAVFFFKETFTKHLITGLSLMMFGVLFLVTKGFSEGINFANGDLFILLSAVSFSFGTLVFKQHVHSPNISFLVAYRAVTGSIILGSILAIWYPNELLSVIHLGPVIHYLIAYALVGVILTYILHYYALENTSMTNNALFTLTSPIIGIVYAHVFLGEQIGSVHIISMTIMLLGLLTTKFDMIQKALMLTKMKFRHIHNS